MTQTQLRKKHKTLRATPQALRALNEVHGLSFTKIGAQLGYSGTTIGNWLRDNDCPLAAERLAETVLGEISSKRRNGAATVRVEPAPQTGAIQNDPPQTSNALFFGNVSGEYYETLKTIVTAFGGMISQAQ